VSLLHVHSRRGADLYGGRAARRAGVPSLITRRVESYEPAWWLRFKLEPYSRVVAISRVIEADLVDRVRCGRFRVARVPSAVDTSVFRPGGDRSRWPASFGVPADARVIGAIAQLIPRKGHATLLRAFAEVVRRELDVWLVIFGRGPREAALRRWAAELSVAERVVFAGHRDDLPTLLPGLDVLVHAAAREGLGVAVLEAMAAGVPVVASRVGGVPDIIDDGITGLLVSPGDSAAIASAVERLLGDAALRRSLAERGRQRVETAYSIARMARAYHSLYREILSEHGSVG
jgi:glycosyltransferase involved in cell wall biosynthesis